MISVIIPLYNKELSIRNTIISVLEQNYQNFEIIVINDGSTDTSVEAVSSLEDKRIRLIHQTNQGVSAARNHGIKESKYEWVAFLDADDIWEKYHLQEIVMMMEEYPKEKVFVTSFTYSDKRRMFKHLRKQTRFKIDNYFKEALKEELLCTSIVVFHKSCIQVVGDFNENLNRGEDLDLWFRLARKFNMIKSDVVTATYRIDAENRTSLSKELEKTHVYNFNLEEIQNIDEKKYCEYLILSHMYQYFKTRDFTNFVKLKNKHPKISYFKFFSVLMKNIFSFFYKRLKNSRAVSLLHL